jgi:ABC-type uncharacterized transport system ATPase subunit
MAQPAAGYDDMTSDHCPTTPDPLVSLRGVRKQFATVTAVNDITLDIPAGGVFALLGPNGAGKTTLLRLLLGLILPDAGSVTWQQAYGPDPRVVGYLPEDRGPTRMWRCCARSSTSARCGA